jgi:hypothetical protein
VLVALVGYGVLSTLVAAPRVFGDEVIYPTAGRWTHDGSSRRQDRSAWHPGLLKGRLITSFGRVHGEGAKMLARSNRQVESQACGTA